MPRLLRSLALGGILLLLLTGAAGPVAGRPGAPPAPRASAAAVAMASLAFRSDGGSGFEARAPGYGVSVSAEGATVSDVAGHPSLRLRLDGAHADAAPSGRAPLPGRVNLFVGDDPSQWRTDVTTYSEAAYTGVWDGVDVVWHGRGPHLEQDFVVAPGGDPGRIGISFPGGHEVRVTGGGDLVVQLAAGRARFGAPTLYQDAGNRRRRVPGAFVARGDGRVGFQVGAHDPTRALVIDPVLLESTFLGGDGNDNAYGVAVAGDGGVYVTGSTESSDFPVAGPVQANLAQGDAPRPDVFVAKFKPDGSGLAYSTFLGGRGRDIGYAIALGPDGSAYVSGSTESTDFPLARPVQKSYGGGAADAFVAKLGPQGAVLQYSTYLGGGGADGSRGIAVDPAGSAYVAGTTTSNDFPTAGPPLQGTPNHPDDTAGFVTKVDPGGGAWVYSTYLGGSGDDHAMAVAVGPGGDAYVVGDTRSADFPISRGLQTKPGSPSGPGAVNADAFVIRLASSGSSLAYATYLGGFESDLATGVAVDASGAAYVTGSTGSSNFPLVKAFQINRRGAFDAFVSKINPGGSGLVYSTFLGGSDSEEGAAITVGADGSASVTGSVASGDFPTFKPFQAAKGGGFTDGFVATYTPSGSAVTLASYMGGRGDDQGTAIASGGSGTLSVAGYTGSPDFPLVGPMRPARGGIGDAFVATVGEPPVGATKGSSAPPARERRIRIFGAVTSVLFLGAITQTLWLRRRQAPDEPVPVAVGGPAAARNRQWYTPTPPKLSDLPPLRPRAVPKPTTRKGKSAPAPDSVGPGAGDLPVPDLLPGGDEEEWAGEPTPAEADFWTTTQIRTPDSATAAGPPVDVQAPDLWGPTDAQEAAAVDPATAGAAAPPLSVDMQAPDLWDVGNLGGPDVAFDGEDLSIDPMWTELLAAEAPGAAPAAAEAPPSPEAPSPEVPAKARPVEVPPAKARGAKATPPKAPPAKARPPKAPAAEAPAAEAPPPRARPAVPTPPAKGEPAPVGPAASERARRLRPRRTDDAAPASADASADASGEPAVPDGPPAAAAGSRARRTEASGEAVAPAGRRRRKSPTDEPTPPDQPTVAADRDWIAELWPESPAERPAEGAEPVPVAEASVHEAPADDAPRDSTGVAEPAGDGDAPAPRGWRARRRAAAEVRASREPSSSPSGAQPGGPPTPLSHPTPPSPRGPQAEVPAAGVPPAEVPAAEVPAAQSVPAPSHLAPTPPASSPPASAPPSVAPLPPASPPAAPAPRSSPDGPTPPARPRPPSDRPVPAPETAGGAAASSPPLPPQAGAPPGPPPAPAGRQPGFLPPAGDPFAPPTAAPEETPAPRPGAPSRFSLPPRRPRRTPEEKTAGASDQDRRAARVRPSPPPPPVPPRRGLDPLATDAGRADTARPDTPDLERGAVEAGLADLVGNVELADVPDGATPWLASDFPEPGVAPHDDPAVADALAEEPAGPGAAEEVASEEVTADPRAPEQPEAPEYPALPEAAPGRWRGSRSRRGPTRD